MDFDIIDEKINQKGCELNLLAKSKGYGGTSLLNHLIEAARASLTVASLSTFPVNKHLIEITSFVGGLFHDIGKSANGFQAMIQIDEIKRWPEKVGGNRHEIISAAIFYFNLHNLTKWKENQVFFKAAYLAILTHHRAFQRINDKPIRALPSNQFFGNDRFRKMYNEIQCNRVKIENLWSEIRTLISEDTWGESLFSNGWLPIYLKIPPYEELTKTFNEMLQLLSGYSIGQVIPGQIKKSWFVDDLAVMSVVRAFVITGDHLSSGNMYNIIPTPSISKYNIIPDGAHERHFQKIAKKTHGSALLIAPTGSGKTEAALNWISLNQKTKFGDSKIFFVLPFTASINAMAKRLHKLLEVNHGLVGVMHSKSAEVMFSIIEEEVYENKTKFDHNTMMKFEDAWSNNFKVKTNWVSEFSNLLFTLGKGKKRKNIGKGITRVNLAAKQLANLSKEVFYPIKVTTPHQLLKGILQGKGWEAIVCDFYNGCFVFDEIHAYQPHLVGMIFNLVNTLIKDFNSIVLIMSATFPKFLIDLIHNYIPNVFNTIIRPDPEIDKKILSRKRHNIEVSKKSLLSFIREFNFTKFTDKGKQILIICNTIKSAQTVYQYLREKYKGTECILFHSRFKQIDRNQKEKRVENHKEDDELKIVVATQVVEVSLDIDFDIGICEIAPLDALIQRFGRINRVGNNDCISTNIWVTNYEERSKYVYEEKLIQASLELLETNSGKVFSEAELIKLVDQLYEMYPWSDLELNQFVKAFDWEAIESFRKNSIPGSYRHWIDEVIEENSNIEVLLEEDELEYRKNWKKNFIGVNELLIKIRFSKRTKIKFDPQNVIPPILTKGSYNYNPEIGLTFDV